MAQITKDTIINIYKETQAGKSLKEVAQKYNVSIATVRRIKNKKYKKYAEIINEYEKTSTQATTPEEAKQLTGEEILNQKLKNLDEEIVKNDLLAVLLTFFTPRTVKWLNDELFNQKPVQEIINQAISIVKQFPEEKQTEKYSEIIKTLTISVLASVVNPDYVEALLTNVKKNKGTSDEINSKDSKS